MSLTESLAEWINTTNPIHSIDQVAAGNLGIYYLFYKIQEISYILTLKFNYLTKF